MRQVPARILRALVLEAGLELPAPTKSQLEKMPRILAAARAVFATTLVHEVKLAKFARQIHMSPDTVGRIYLDMEYILAEILREHLNAVAAAIDAVPADTPELIHARRAAYYAATRERNGDFVPDHKIFTRQYGLLPPDLKGPIDELYAGIALRLSEDGSNIAITMLDTPRHTLYDAEILIAAIPPRNRTAAAAPNPTPTIDWTKPAEPATGQPPAKPRRPTLH